MRLGRAMTYVTHKERARLVMAAGILAAVILSLSSAAAVTHRASGCAAADISDEVCTYTLR